MGNSYEKRRSLLYLLLFSAVTTPEWIKLLRMVSFEGKLDDSQWYASRREGILHVHIQGLFSHFI
jgi:hypothetical protein